MAKLPSIYLAADVKYTGGAPTSSRWPLTSSGRRESATREDDLLAVIRISQLQERQSQDLARSVDQRGMKNFPKNTQFPFLVAGLEIEKGPRRGNLYLIRSYLEKSMLLAQGSSNPIDIKLIPEIKSSRLSSEPPDPGLVRHPLPRIQRQASSPIFRHV